MPVLGLDISDIGMFPSCWLQSRSCWGCPHIKWVTWLSENWCKLWVDTLDTNTSKEHLQVSIVSIFRSCAWRVWPEACVWSSLQTCKSYPNLLTWTHRWYVCLLTPFVVFCGYGWDLSGSVFGGDLGVWVMESGLPMTPWSVPFSEFPATVPSNYWSQQLTAQHCFTVSCNGGSGLGLCKVTLMHLAKQIGCHSSKYTTKNNLTTTPIKHLLNGKQMSPIFQISAWGALDVWPAQNHKPPTLRHHKQWGLVNSPGLPALFHSR